MPRSKAEGGMEKAVERMSRLVVGKVRSPAISCLSVSGWDGLGRRKVLDSAIEALHAFVGKEFCGILRIEPSYDSVADNMRFIEAAIQEELGISLLPDPNNPRDVDKYVETTRQGPLVVIIFYNWLERLPLETLRIPYIGRTGAGAFTDIIKFVFTTHSSKVRSEMREVLPEHYWYVDVAKELDSLTDETALEVVRLEARDMAHDIIKHFPSLMDINDRLVDIITECFLYCSLLPTLYFPEEYWLSEGFFGGLGFGDVNYLRGTFQSMDAIFSGLRDRFGSSKRFLTYHRLLEIPFPLEKKFAKIVSSSTREQKGKYMVQHSRELKEVVMADWSADLFRISLANSQIEVIHPPFSAPYLPSTSTASFTKLSTLLLQDNAKLREIPDAVFLLMPNLRVLDLSFTSIETLPSSIYTLNNLRMLSLQGCQELETIDAAGFDKLEVLNLWCCPLRGLKRASWELPNLKTIILLGGAVNLEELNLSLKDDQIFNLQDSIIWNYEEQRPSQHLQKCSILIMYPGEEEEQDKRKRRDSFFQGSRFPYSDIYRQVKCLAPSAHPPSSTCTSSYRRCLEVFGGNNYLNRFFLQISDPEFLSLNNTSFYGIPTEYTSNLKSCQINRCHHVISQLFHGSCYLSQLETIWISTLTKYSTSVVFDFYPSKYPGDAIPFLKSIYLENCPSLKAIFNQRVDLPNLEVMEIKFCCRLEMVFNEKDVTGEMMVPKLKSLLLLELPMLSTICNGQLPSLRQMMVRGCYNLRKIPFPLPNHQKDATKVKVHGELKWWNNLKGVVKVPTDFKEQHERVQLKRYPKMWP